jgi:UDP-N-acetylmuramoylalanine--D-glutamate ligase
MIDLSAWEGKTVAVMGLGKTGESTCAALLKANANVLAWDDNEDNRTSFKHQELLSDLNECDFQTLDALILSPGIPHNHPRPHPLAQKAVDAVLPIFCDIELFARAVTDIPYVGITGTNGKSTTTALIGHILNYYQSTDIGGNIGKPVLSMKRTNVKDYVLELSSYQLERSPSIAPKVAVWLNITPDHLDRHGDMDGYINAKRKIFANYTEGSIAVIGIDDNHSAKVADTLQERSEWDIQRVSVHKKVDNGYYIENGILYRIMQKPKDLDDSQIEDTSIYGEPFMCTDLKTYPRLKGVHNWQNAACAFAACEAMGLSAEQIEIAMRDFAGLPHRQYVVEIINGIPYVNDSKATNADAASMALRSFEQIYWILGGRSKDTGLEGLQEFTEKVKHAFLIGEAQGQFSEWLEKHDIPYSLCGTLDAATIAAHDMAQGERGLPGGAPVVLLSPACASFDQFDSFEQRGDAFAKVVKQLAKKEAQSAA